MSVVVDETGVSIQTSAEVLEEVVVAIETELALTSTQAERVRSSVQSSLGQLSRIWSEQESAVQEAILAVYSTLSFFSSGAALDRVVRLLGVVRNPSVASRVTGPAAGTPGTIIPTGSRIQYGSEETIWEVVDGPFVIGGGGTVTITIEAEDDESALTVALDPDTGFDDWAILDTVVGWTSFESAAQPIVGAPVETDAALRTRAGVEAFRRGQGPLRAIDAAGLEVDGVTYFRTYENRTLVVDANLINPKAINVVALGGDDQEILDAIFASRSAGAEIFAVVDGTEVTGTVLDVYGFSHAVAFNRVLDVEIWIRITLTTTTAEDAAPADVDDTVTELALAQAEDSFGIGDDVRPFVITGAIFAAGIPGIDNVAIELSEDGAIWHSNKATISIRERAVFETAHIVIVHV